MSVRRGCTSAARDRCATTSPAPTAVTAKLASSGTPSAGPVSVGGRCWPGTPLWCPPAPGPAPGQPSSHLVPPSGLELRLALPASVSLPAAILSGCASLLWSPRLLSACSCHPSFLPLAVSVHPSVSASSLLPTFLLPFSLAPGLVASPVPCPGSSLSLLLGLCVSVLTQPPLLPAGGGSWLPGAFCPPYGPPTLCLPPARRRERVLDLTGPSVPAHV